MGVTLRYCDLCGNKLESVQLDAPDTLKIKDKIFCAVCRPKVMAKIEAQKLQAKKQTGPSPAGAAGSSGQPTRVAVRAAAPSAGPEQSRHSPAPAGPKNTGVRSAGTSGAGSSARTGAPLSRAASPSGIKAASRRQPGQDRRSGAEGQTGEEGGEKTFHIHTKSKAPMYVAWGVIVLLVAGAITWYVNQPAAKTDSPATVKATETPKAPDRSELARKALEEARAFWGTNSDEYRLAHDKFEQLRNSYWEECGKEAQELRDQVMETWKRNANAALSSKMQELNALQDSDRFVDAVEACKILDPIIVDYSEYKWDEYAEFEKFAISAKTQAEAHAYLAELLAKGRPYAEQDAGDIASLILEQFQPENFAGTKIHAVYERYKKQIESQGVKAWKDLQESAAATALAKTKAKEEAERQERMARWTQELATKKWESQVGKYDIYNWTCIAGSWKHEVQGGIGVLAGDNSSNATTYAGIFNSHWQDYVLRFEVKIDRGSISISPRTDVTGGRIRDQSELIQITADELGAGKWLEITMEVQGDSVRIFRADKSQTEPWKTLAAGDEYRLLKAGGFVLYLGDASAATIRKVETKLISSTRSRKF